MEQESDRSPSREDGLALDRIAGRVARSNGRWGLALGRLLDRRIDVVRTPEEIRVSAAVPDVAEDSIKVTVDDDDVLRIRGLYRSPDGRGHAKSFDRAMWLHARTDETERQAVPTDGRLTVRLRRRARQSPSRYRFPDAERPSSRSSM